MGKNSKDRKKDRAVSNNFGSTLRFWREKRGLSLQDMYERTGVSNSYISRLEIGERKSPSIPISSKLANALDIPLSLLLDVSSPQIQEDEIPLVAELILYNDCKMDSEHILSKDGKEAFIQIIEFIFEMSWEADNKLQQLFDLSELINDFKEVCR